MIMTESQWQPASNLPLVSLGIPTYNRAAGLREALTSVVNQNYSNLEITISDNASTDATPEIAQSFVNSDVRVHYRRQPANYGPIPNFKAVMESAHGKYFMWLSDDDWLDSGYIRACVAVLEGHPDHSLVCGKTLYYRQGKFCFEGVRVDLPEPAATQRVLNYYRKVKENGTYYGLMRTAYLKHLPLNESLGSDWLVVAALAFLGKVKTLDEVCIHRDFTWTERSFDQIIANNSLPEIQARYPYLTIAVTAFRDINHSGPIYHTLPAWPRFFLALRAFRILCRRHRVRWHTILGALRHGYFCSSARPGSDYSRA